MALAYAKRAHLRWQPKAKVTAKFSISTLAARKCASHLVTPAGNKSPEQDGHSLQPIFRTTFSIRETPHGQKHNRYSLRLPPCILSCALCRRQNSSDRPRMNRGGCWHQREAQTSCYNPYQCCALMAANCQ